MCLSSPLNDIKLTSICTDGGATVSKDRKLTSVWSEGGAKDSVLEGFKPKRKRSRQCLRLRFRNRTLRKPVLVRMNDIIIPSTTHFYVKEVSTKQTQNDNPHSNSNNNDSNITVMDLL